MSWTAEPLLDVEVIRDMARAQRVRAERAMERANRFKRQLITATNDAQRAMYASMAAIHSSMAERHRTSAELHERYVSRLGTWARRGKPWAEPPPRFMAVVASELGSPSAGITLLGPDRTPLSMIVSDAVATGAQNLEFDLGEGPVHDATRQLRAVQAGVGEAMEKWPSYSPALADLGVRSVVSVPLTQTGNCLGALTRFDSAPLDPSPELLPRLTAVADALTHTMLLAGQPVAAPDGPAGPLLRDQDLHAVTHQAAGMVAVQCGCTVEDALALIQARAFVRNDPVETIASQVVRRQLRFDDR